MKMDHKLTKEQRARICEGLLRKVKNNDETSRLSTEVIKTKDLLIVHIKVVLRRQHHHVKYSDDFK